jgi:hypothetical protein
VIKFISIADIYLISTFDVISHAESEIDVGSQLIVATATGESSLYLCINTFRITHLSITPFSSQLLLYTVKQCHRLVFLKYLVR